MVPFEAMSPVARRPPTQPHVVEVQPLPNSTALGTKASAHGSWGTLSIQTTLSKLCTCQHPEHQGVLRLNQLKKKNKNNPLTVQAMEPSEHAFAFPT